MSTVGRVLPHLECKIVDPDTGAVVPRGTAGELCTRGYSVMLGYWNDSDATAQAIDAAGWMHSGDLAIMNDDGYVSISGRIKDMIIRGGENVYPREVEEFLYTHPKVSEVQVIGVPDPQVRRGRLRMDPTARRGDGHRGRDPRILPRPDRHLQDSALRPVHHEFPMTVTGKIQKFRMREISAEELGLSGVSSIQGRLT